MKQLSIVCNQENSSQHKGRAQHVSSSLSQTSLPFHNTSCPTLQVRPEGLGSSKSWALRNFSHRAHNYSEKAWHQCSLSFKNIVENNFMQLSEIIGVYGIDYG